MWVKSFEFVKKVDLLNLTDSEKRKEWEKAIDIEKYCVGDGVGVSKRVCILSVYFISPDVKSKAPSGQPLFSGHVSLLQPKASSRGLPWQTTSVTKWASSSFWTCGSTFVSI